MADFLEWGVDRFSNVGLYLILTTWMVIVSHIIDCTLEDYHLTIKRLGIILNSFLVWEILQHIRMDNISIYNYLKSVA